MLFRFAALGGGTRVWASCAEHLPTVRRIFENFLQQIETHYPAVGPLWQDYQTKCEMQRIERIKKYVNMKPGDAGRAVTVTEDEPLTATKQAAQPPLAQAAIPKRRRGRMPIAPKEKNLICADWLKVQYDVTQDDFCNRKGISPSLLRSWLKGYPYPES
jgi:hypothetical protein